jgi:hypothetical protein
MIATPSDEGWPAHQAFPRRRLNDASTNLVDGYLAALEQSLAGQIDPALEANGIYTPLGQVARAALVEAIGADLEAAARDLMLQGVPRIEAEAQAIAGLGAPPDLRARPADCPAREVCRGLAARSESVWWCTSHWSRWWSRSAPC